MAEQSERAKSGRRWNIIIALVLLAIIVIALYSCTRAGVKESPAAVPTLLALIGLP